MSKEERALRWAKQVWSESALHENEIAHGADRVARRFASPRRALLPHGAWKAAGVTVVLGALAYGARGAWLPPRAAPRSPAPVSVEPQVEPPSAPSMAASPAEPAAAIEEATPPTPQPFPAGRTAPADKKRRTGFAEPAASLPPAGAEPTWVEVSDALAAHDHARAEQLLLELSNGRHDANTRAKAHLGLAQLDESRDDCESARKHALYAASIPDIEIKTVRRALELAARCSR
jgi:hypothetical protein